MYTKPMTSEDHENWLEMMGEPTEETKERINKALAVINCYQARSKTSKQPLSLLSARRADHRGPAHRGLIGLLWRPNQGKDPAIASCS